MVQQGGSESSTTSPLPPQTTENYQKVMGGLAELFGATRKRPPVKELDGEVVRIGEIPVAGGTYSDVWCGKWLGQHLVSLTMVNHLVPRNSLTSLGGNQVIARCGNQYS